MDEATIVVDKYVDSDPEQARWYGRICESFEGTRVSIVASPWDQALANRVPLDLGAVNRTTLDAKLAMAEVVLRGVDRANRRRLGLPEEAEHTGNGQRGPDEPPRWHSQPLPPSTGPDSQLLPPRTGPDSQLPPPRTGPDAPLAPNGPERLAAARPPSPGQASAGLDAGPDADGDEPYVRIIPARPKTEQRAE